MSNIINVLCTAHFKGIDGNGTCDDSCNWFSKKCPMMERINTECFTCEKEDDGSPRYCIDCYSRLEKRNIELHNFLNKIYDIVEKWYLSDEDTAEDSMNEIKLILENGYDIRGNQNEQR